MNAQRCSLVGMLGVTILSVGLLGIPTPTHAQSRQSPITLVGVRQNLQNPPSYNYSGGNLGGRGEWANQNWLIVDVAFQTEEDWTDDVTIKYYVLIGDSRDRKLLTGEVTHINIQKGRRHYSGMFVHPSTLDRYGRGKVEAVAVQIFHKGQLMDTDGDPKPSKRWWEQFTPTPGYLLSPQESPWSVVAHERYEAIKAP